MPMNKDKILQLARNFRGRARNCINIARARVEKALQHAYVGRKLKKRYWRSVWIQRINAGTREHGVSHAQRHVCFGGPRRAVAVAVGSPGGAPWLHCPSCPVHAWPCGACR